MVSAVFNRIIALLSNDTALLEMYMVFYIEILVTAGDLLYFKLICYSGQSSIMRFDHGQ